MANIFQPIVISGTKYIKDVIRRFMKRAEFKDEISEDYKNGFNDFGNAIVSTLDKLESKYEDNEGWIPCSVMMPDELEWVLVTTEIGEVDMNMFYRKKWARKMAKPIAWMIPPNGYIETEGSDNNGRS